MRRVLALLVLLLAGCSAVTPVEAPVAVSPAAPTAIAPSPAAAGHAPAKSFAVATRTLRFQRGDRKLPTTVYYPKSSGHFPVVVFGHGLTGSPTGYAELLRRWAAAGFVIAAPAFPHTSAGAAKVDVMDVLNQPADVSAVLDGLTALPGSDPLRKILDLKAVAAAGHSAGGITTVGVFSAQPRDPRFTAGIVLAGNSLGVGQTFTGTPAPILFVHADKDPVVPAYTDRAVFDALPWPRAFLRLSGDGHSSPYVSRRDSQFGVVASTTVDFLRWALYRDSSARARLLRVRGLDAHL
ncbi:dienelactone hydrolase [Hamadaea flava]|uniref:Alpha/beta hydrolase family protein n=1 Tax=Hamadaea flava TaxID=1742688 RepID=A0ABV8LJQ5_9ACTN|nr:dienelactone hydrolase family protein [Hamadaea flava]MCP2325333.1 dienelactone hydrolase [Hamadaea flava]